MKFLNTPFSLLGKCSPLLFCFVLLAVSLFSVSDVFAISQRSDQILILHSYSVNFKWTQQIQKGIIEALGTEHVHTEFIDAKYESGTDYFDQLSSLYKIKYASRQLDGIIVADNAALHFIERYGQEVFPDIPVVACGINNLSLSTPSSQVKSIIIESADHLATLKQGLKLFPYAKNIYVILDATITSKAFELELKKEAKLLTDSVQVHFVREKSFAELKKIIANIDESDLVYMLPYFKSIDGKMFFQGEAEKEVTNISPAPVFVSWAYQLGTGVIGGKTIHALDMGKEAGQKMISLLSGKVISPLIFNEGRPQSTYDYNTIGKFGVAEHLLPEDFIVINQPLSFWAQYRIVLLPTFGGFVVLLIIITLLSSTLLKQKEVAALDREIIETQRELVATLGEVIEVRSQETGNHVRRVAYTSKILSTKLGLDKKEVRLLVAASPMHDVGKIGILEKILHKKGKLTVEEYEIIKTHTDIGCKILNNSDRPLLKMACDIAGNHHERWDGTGYPRGLSGQEISVYARITTLADIYDAVSSDRCYKKAWPEERVLDYIQSERGKIFDPKIVDTFFEHLDEIREGRKLFP